MLQEYFSIKGGSNVKNKNYMSMKSRFGFNFFDVFVYSFCFVFAVICFYPMWYVVIGSVSNSELFTLPKFNILPDWPITFKYYAGVIFGGIFFNSLLLSILKALFASVSSLILSASMAYGVAKKKVAGMKFVNLYVLLTMFFGGGLIPTYLLVRSLHMIDTFWALTIPSLLGAFQFVILRNYFSYSVSTELEDAALIDGANEVLIFFRIILPLSMPTISALFLFQCVEQWNDWYSYLVYCNKPELQPVTWLLRRVLTDPAMAIKSDNKDMASMIHQLGYLPPASLKMATIVLSMVPIMILYPFLQKNFAKGMLIGAVKG